MRISHGSRIIEMYDRNGYGYATVQMLASLERLGYEVNENDKTADVEIWFDQPEHWNFSEGPYKIGYHPWESTELMPGWTEIMNQCDELWTPSPLMARWYVEHAGVTVPVYVYEHGVDPIWSPVERKVGDTFKFLHVGAEAARKGFKEAATAFRQAFGYNEPVELNCKMFNPGWKIGGLFRVNYLNSSLPIEDLIQLYHDNHAFVYPSWGEGFGLTPLQAMATGMPTITVPAWAPYARFLNRDLSISSELVGTPYPRHHPGMMFQPNVDEVAAAMRNVYENYEHYEKDARARVEEITAYYDWDRLTQEAFENLKMRLENS